MHDNHFSRNSLQILLSANTSVTCLTVFLLMFSENSEPTALESSMGTINHIINVSGKVVSDPFHFLLSVVRLNKFL